VQITAVTFVKKNTATFGKLIIAVYASVVYVYIPVHVCQVDKSIIPYLLEQGVGLWGVVSKKIGSKSVEDNADTFSV